MGFEKLKSAKGWKNLLLILPPPCLLSLSNAMTAIIFTDMIVYDTCQSLLMINESSCDLMLINTNSTEAKEIAKIVQPQANFIVLCNSLISGIISAVLILFFGPWSDKYGRKPLLIMGCLAPSIANILKLIINYWEVSPWMLMIASAFSALGGGEGGLMLASICFVADITSIDDRAWYLAILGEFVEIGEIIGIFIGLIISELFGYTFVFAIASILTIIASLHVMLNMPESVQKEKYVRCGNPLNPRLVQELFESLIKRRPELNRRWLWCGILILSLLAIVTTGNDKINEVFMCARVGWNWVQYIIYEAISTTAQLISTLIALKFMDNYFELSDILQILIGCLSGFLTMLLIAFSTKPWHLYLASCVNLLSDIIGPIIQSIISISAPPEDIGKVVAVLKVSQILMPLGAAPLYTFIYSNYKPPIYPSPVYLLSAVIFLLMMLSSTLLNWRLIKSINITKKTIQKD